MARDKRDWQSLDEPGIETPLLDDSNLPVHKSEPIDPRTFKFRPKRLFSYDLTEHTGKELFGTGKPIFDEEGALATKQSFMGKFGRGLVSRGLSVVPKIGQGIGHIGGAITFGLDYMIDKDSADPNVIWENYFVDTMSNIDEGLREAMPIYKSHYGRTGNLLQQMADPGFWFDDMFDSLAFLASAYATGAATGAIAKSLGLSKAMVQGAKVYGAMTLNSISESGFEAKDFQDSERARLAYSKYDMAYERLSGEQKDEINEIVAPATANVFRGNMGVLLIPNYIQSRFMYGKIGDSAKRLRAAVKAGKLSVDDVKIFKTAAKQATTGIFSEGPWEEGMQHALQTYSGRKEAFGQKYDDYMLGVLNQWVDNLFTTEGQKNMVMGSIIGGLFGAFGGVSEAKGEAQEISRQEMLFKKLKIELGGNNRLYFEHVTRVINKNTKLVEKEDEEGNLIKVKEEIYVDENGKVDYDYEAASRMFLYNLGNKFLYDEAGVAAVDGNDLHLKQVNSDAVARLYFNYATNEGIDSLDEVDSLLMEREMNIPKELEDEGIKNTFTAEDLKPYREAFERTQSILRSDKDFSQSDTEASFKMLVAKTLYANQIKRNQYREYMSDPNIPSDQKESIQKFIDDSQAITDALSKTDTRDKLYEEYKVERQNIQDYYNKVKDLQSEDKPNSDAIDLAQYEAEEFAYINGDEVPFSTAFEQGVRGVTLANPLGARYNYFMRTGQIFYRKAELNQMIEDARKNKIPEGRNTPMTVGEVVNTVVEDIKAGVKYTKEDIAKVEALITSKERSRIRGEKQKRSVETAIIDNPIPTEFVDNPTFDAEKYAADKKWIENFDARSRDLERAKEAFNNGVLGVELPTDNKQMRDHRRAYRYFQREFADKPVEDAEDILIKQMGNPESYEDIDELRATIDALNRQLSIFKMPGRGRMLTTREFKESQGVKGYIESVKDVLSRLKKIEKTVEDNQHNRELQDLRSKNSNSDMLFSAIGIGVNRKDGTHSIINSKLYDIIAKAIGVEKLEAILESASKAKYAEVDHSYDAIYVEKIIQEIKKSKDGVKYIEKAFKGLQSEYIGNFIDLYRKLDALQRPGGQQGMNMSLTAYKKNPFKVFDELIDLVVGRQDNPIDKISVVDKFLRDKDAFELQSALKSGKPVIYKSITKAELLGLLDAHIKLLGIAKLRQRINSNISIVDMLSIESQISNKNLAPSHQQRITLREIMIAHKAKGIKFSVPYAGWVYIKGLAGTGKTQLISKYLSDLLGIGPDGVVAMSTHENALSVLKESLPGIKTTILHTALTDEMLKDENVEILILDEVGRVSGVELNDLASRIAEANKTRKNPIRTYVLGDPSQVINKNDDFAAINIFFGDMINIQEVSPLTAVFRSGNTALLHIQSAFLDFPGKVKMLRSKASAKIGSMADGVHISTISNDLINQIRVHKKNQRTKAVVISNERLKKQYKKEGVPVFMYYDIAGLEFGEVYIDIDPSDFKLDRKYNSTMYTVLSRAQAYAFVKSYQPGDNWKSTVDVVQQVDVTNRINKVRADYTNQLSFEIEAMGEEMKGATISTPQFLAPDQTNEDEIVEEQTENGPTEDDPLSEENTVSDTGEWIEDINSKGGHEPEYPSYYPIKEALQGQKPLIRKGSRVKYIKVKNPDTGKFEIWAVGQQLNIDDTPLEGDVWEKIAVLSQNELTNTEFGRYLTRQSALAVNERGEDLSNGLKYGDKGSFIVEDLNSPTILAEGTIHRANPLSYRYAKDNKITKSGPGFIRGLITKIENLFGQPQPEDLSFEIKIFDKKEADYVSGVPYLIVSRKTTREGKKEVAREQYISLSGRILKLTDGFLKPAFDFLKLSKQIDAIKPLKLGDPSTNTLIKRFRKNFTVQDDKLVPWHDVYNYKEYTKERDERKFPVLTENQFNQLAKISKDIIPLFYGVGMIRKHVANENAMWDYVGKDMKKHPDTDYIFVPNKNGDGGTIKKVSKEDPTKIQWEEVEGPKGDKGFASHVMNMLAKTNPGSLFAVRQRIYVYSKTGKRQKSYYTKAKSLLAEEDTYGQYYEHLTTLFKSMAKEVGQEDRVKNFIEKAKSYTEDELTSKLEEQVIALSKLSEKVDDISMEDINKLKTEHISNLITSETLQDILSFDSNGQHETLYMPLKLKQINKLGADLMSNIGKLEDLLGTKLEDISRTRIQITLDKKIEEQKPKAKPKNILEAGIKRAEQRINKRRKRHMRDGRNLGRPITIPEAQKLAEQFIPTINEEGEDILRFVDSMILKELAGEDSYGLYQDETIYVLERDGQTFKNIIRHESFHKIFNEYLSDTEQDLLINSFKKEFPQHKDKGPTEIEELIAEAFQNYQTKKLTVVNEVLKRFFNWLARTFKFVNRNVKNLDRLFSTIESGYFTEIKNRGTGVTMALKEIKKRYGSKHSGIHYAIDIYKTARGIIQDQFYDLQKDGHNGIPVTREEMVIVAKDNIRRLHLDAQEDYVKTIAEEKDISDKNKTSLQHDIFVHKKAFENYEHIINDIYDSWDFSKRGEIFVEDGDLSTEEIVNYYKKDVNRVNLNDVIIESDEVDRERKLSKEVKDYLSNLQLANGFMMNWREAFVRSLNILEGIETFSKDFLVQLNDKWKTLGSNPRDLTIINELKLLYNDATRDNYLIGGAILPNNMRFISEDEFLYADEDVSNAYGKQGVSVIPGGRLMRRPKGDSTRAYLARIEIETGVPVEILAAHFRKYQRTDAFSSILNHFNNQKQKNIFIIEKKWVGKGAYSIQYIPGSHIGVHGSLASTLREKLGNKFKKQEDIANFIKDWLKPQQKQFSKNRLQFVKNFLFEIGMGNLAVNIPDIGINVLYNDIDGFFERAEKELEQEIPATESDEMAAAVADETSEDVDTREMTMADILVDEGKMVRKLAALMAKSSANVRATSIRDVKKEKKYIWSPTSNAHSILFNFVNNRLFKRGKISMSMPSHLKSDLFKYNSFISGKNTIHDVIDHDGIRDINYNGEARGVVMSNEDRVEFMVRNFIAGFLDRIRHSSEDHERYIQFLYPNERKNSLGAEVNVLTFSEVRDIVKDIILQVSNRPEIRDLEIYDKNSFINLHLVEEVVKENKNINEKNVDKYADRVMVLMEREADKLTKYIINLKIPFDINTHSIHLLNKFTKERVDLKKLKNSSLYKKNVTRTILDEKYAIPEEAIKQMALAFFANNYVNSYFLNQLILSDYAQYSNEEDIIRRGSLSTAPGTKPIVHKVFGMRPKARILMLEDPIKNTDDIRERIESLLITDDEKENLDVLVAKFKDNFSSGDGQGFILPERLEELKVAGFSNEFNIGSVLKPVIYSIDERGIVRGIKYSAVELSDALIRSFPSLGVLRDNMRANSIDEAVFGTGVKLGQPKVNKEAYKGMHHAILNGHYTVDPSFVFEINNNDYRIQHDPRAEIEGAVRQPSQLLYIIGVLKKNNLLSDEAYNHFAEIVRLGRSDFNNKFDTKEKVKKNISTLLGMNGNQREYDMVKGGLSIDFPSVTNKIVTQLSAHLQKLLVDVRWPGTKLVLQSDYGVRKYGQRADGKSGKLRFYRDPETRADKKQIRRLIAEVIIPRGVLPKEYEKQITKALAKNKHAENYYDLPDLLGYRIPSSDLHSAIAMKVVGFYDTADTSVIIAPDLLVALHGSDFDVDSLFIVKRSVDKEGNPVGYKKQNKKWVFQKNINEFENRDQAIAYHKNGILDAMLDIISSPENINEMLSPIPIDDIKEQKNRVIEERGLSQKLDLSNFNDVIKSHRIIFDAAKATGKFGNAAKGISYMFHSGEENSSPKLRKDETPIIITNDEGKQVVYDHLRMTDESGQSLTVSLDGFINVAIDNIRELALSFLNINNTTINGFIGLRALGVDLETTVDILQQPIMLEYANTQARTNKKQFEIAIKKLTDKLGSNEIDLTDVEVSTKSLRQGYKIKSIDEIGNAVVNEKVNKKNRDILLHQLAVITMFRNANRYGDSIGEISRFLNIGRELPISKVELDEVLDTGYKLFREVSEDGSMSNFSSSSFPFDVANIFKRNPHLLEIYKTLINYNDIIEKTIKKYDPVFSSHIDKIVTGIGGLITNQSEAREFVRTQFLNYIISNEIYSGEYKVDLGLVHTYGKEGQERHLTGPKAANQIFIQKIRKLQEYLSTKHDKEGNPLENKFLDHLSEIYNKATQTYELRFEGGTNIDHTDLLDLQGAFYELNRYDVKYDNKTKKYKVIEHREPRADDKFSDFQKEFVTYGVMNWGLNFGVLNYSYILPEQLYLSVDKLFNKLMDRFIGENSEVAFDRIADDFLLQFSVNNANLIKNFDFIQEPTSLGKYQNKQDQTRNIYQGVDQESGIRFDRKYEQEEGTDYPRIIKAGFKKYIYVRLNDPSDPFVYYAEVDLASPFTVYHTTDIVLDNGYRIDDYFRNDTRYGHPIRNFRVPSVDVNNIEYLGEDMEEGDIISMTLFHDITRTNKVYFKVRKKVAGVWIIKRVKTIPEAKFETVDELAFRVTDEVAERVDQIKDHYLSMDGITGLIDTMASRSSSKRRATILNGFREQIINQGFKIRFGTLPKGRFGSYMYDGSIVVDLMNIYRAKGQIENDFVDRIITHELAHGLQIIPYLEDEGLRREIDDIIKEFFDIDKDTGRLKPKNPAINKILSDALPGKGDDFRGFKDTGEFVAEIFANDQFAKAVDLLKDNNKKGIVRRIIDWIMQKLGLSKDQEDFNTLSYNLVELFKNSPHRGQWRLVAKTAEGYLMIDNDGNERVVEPAYYEEVEVEEPVVLEDTEKDETRKLVFDLANKLMNQSKKAQVDKDEKGNELSTYSIQGLLKKIKRVTSRDVGLISFFSNKKIDPNVTFGEHMADIKWGTRDHDHKLDTELGTDQTYEEYRDGMENNSLIGQLKGQIMHLFLKRIANKKFRLGMKDEDIVREINNVASLSGGQLTAQQFQWLEDPKNIQEIYRKAGINVLMDEIDPVLKDVIVIPELTVWSELLGFGGTIDSFIGHADGRWSIIDWKTGLHFGIRTSTDSMKYGIQDIYITDNQRERAKLQVMLYAFILKLNNPDMKFKDLMTVWIPNRFMINVEDHERFVEVQSYLRMIEAFFKDKQALKEAGINPDIYNKILEQSSKIFSVSEYTDKASDVLFMDLKGAKFNPEEEYRKAIDEITIILGKIRGKAKVRVEDLPDEQKERLAELYEKVASMRSDPSLQIDVSPEEEIGKLTEWFGNYSDVDMGVFQVFSKSRSEQYDTYTQQHERDLIRFQQLLKPVLNEYMKNKLRLRLGGKDRLANVNYAELFAFAYKEEMRGGYSRERTITKDDKKEWNNLTTDQQKLLTYFNSMMDKWFIGSDAYLNKIGGVLPTGKKASILEIFNFGTEEIYHQKWYAGWFPKVMKSYEELNYEEGVRLKGKEIGHGDIAGANVAGRFTNKNIRERMRRKLTWYVDNTFHMQNDVKMGLPLKYMDNFQVMNERNYTKNLEFIFDAFNKSMLHKQYMDESYMVGQSLKQYLLMKEKGAGQPMYQNTVKFLEKRIIKDIENKVKKPKYTKTKVTLGKYWDPTAYNPQTGKTGRYYDNNIDLDKIMQAMMNWTSMTIMWLRPMQGGGNGIHAKMLTWRESIKGSIASKFFHIDGDAIDFTIADNIWADKIYFASFLPDVMFGKTEENKLWLLARKLNYIPDNYDYATNRRFLLSTRNRAIDQSSMYLFHSKPEEYVSLTTMAAQLNYLKHPGNGKSLWDNYEVRQAEDGSWDVHWVGGIRGYEKIGKGEAATTREITELTSHEIAKLKKVHERMQGGYRHEEAANLEIYVMGQAMIQFKKYLPRLVMNAMGSKKEVVDLGYYRKLAETRKDPKTGKELPTYEWVRRLNEGRWRTLINFLMQKVNMADPSYKWSELSSEQKQNLIDVTLTLSMWTLMSSLYAVLFYDDDDDDTFKKWWKNYLVLNLSQQYNPMELLHNLETASRPVSLARMYKMTESFTQMLFATGDLMFKGGDNAFTNEGDLKGWNNFKRSIPYLASWEDFSSKMKHGGPTEDWWMNKFERDWR